MDILYTIQPVRELAPYKRYPVSAIATAYWCTRYRRALVAMNDRRSRRSALVNWTFNHYTPMLFTLLETAIHAARQ